MDSSVLLVGLIQYIVLLFSLSVHESAHAWMSDKFGDDLARSQGRISLNPLVHIDMFGTVVFPLIGIFLGGLVIGWAKPTPTNPLAWRDRNKAQFWVSAVGPLSNLLIAICAFVPLKVLMYSGALGAPNAPGAIEPIYIILFIGVTLNVLLMFFNFLPIPPLDGSHVLEVLLPYEAQQGYEQIKPYGFMILLALMFTPLFGWMYSPVQNLVTRLIFM